MRKDQSKKAAIALLEEIITAGEAAVIPLDMRQWILEENKCRTACCMCGDVAIARTPNDDTAYLVADSFAAELDDAIAEVFGVSEEFSAECIYGFEAKARLASAEESDIFQTQELTHSHLTTDHNDRAIAHDFVRLMINKVNTL